MKSREGCCADWPKPCPYHEGWADALEQNGPVVFFDESHVHRDGEEGAVDRLRAATSVANELGQLRGELASLSDKYVMLDMQRMAAEERAALAEATIAELKRTPAHVDLGRVNASLRGENRRTRTVLLELVNAYDSCFDPDSNRGVASANRLGEALDAAHELLGIDAP